MSTLEQEGEEVVGQARCPFESRQSNVGLFAGELINCIFIMVALKPVRLGVTHFILLLFTEGICLYLTVQLKSDASVQMLQSCVI